MNTVVDLPLPEWSEQLETEYAELGKRLESLIPCMEWSMHVPWIDAINKLKKQRGAVIMAHNYQSPEIFHGVADITGDSLGLAQAAAKCDAELIVFCGVYFMAETAKVLAPNRTVLIPDLRAGCSLASSITAADVRALRAKHPGAPVVCYVNTSAAVKAECDACCTSANAVQVVEAMGSDKVIFVPDRYLGTHIAKMTGVELILWDGTCEVHETFTAQQVRHAREQYKAVVVAHPECPPDVLEEADFVGSTSAMGAWLEKHQPKRVALITECSMGDNLQMRFPEIEFVKPCNMCPHMKRINLQNIYEALRDLKYEVHVTTETARRAQGAVDRMLAVGRRERV